MFHICDFHISENCVFIGSSVATKLSLKRLVEVLISHENVLTCLVQSGLTLKCLMYNFCLHFITESQINDNVMQEYTFSILKDLLCCHEVVARIYLLFLFISFACMIIHICPPVPLLLRKWSVLWQGVNWLGPAVCMCTGVCLRACLYLRTNVCVCICQHVDSVSSVGASSPRPGTCGSPPVWVAPSSVPNMRSEPPQPCPALLGSVRPLSAADRASLRSQTFTVAEEGVLDPIDL